MKPLCLYHSADLDGICSAAIVNYALGGVVELYPINYGQVLDLDRYVPRGRTVYVCDFSLPSSEMLEIHSRGSLIWIDHHKSAIIAMQHVTMEYDIAGLRAQGEAGCELTWRYLFPATDLPTAVYLLGRYDVWDLEASPQVLPFQFGARQHLRDPRDYRWVSLLNREGVEDLEEIARDGALLQSYQQEQDRLYAKSFSFETSFMGHRAIVLNRGRASSMIFNSVYDPAKHQLMVSFCKSSGKGWTVSLYTTHKDLDVSVIATNYGGGGHAQAAGFSCSVLPFDLP